MNYKDYDICIVGSGLFGSVLSERINATYPNIKVIVLEKRDHIGGNCYTYEDDNGIIVHKYGSHIFHTKNKKVWDYLNRFTKFNNYKHKVVSRWCGNLWEIPINLNTISKFYRTKYENNPELAKDLIHQEVSKSKIKNPKNLEEKAISMIGEPMYNAFIKGYTQKQWGHDPKELPASIINRIPIRYTNENLYFLDEYQGMPLNGYTPIFQKLLKNSTVHLSSDFFEIKNKLSKKCIIIYTGPIDRYFNYKFGELGWRSLEFDTETIKINNYQNRPVINYPDIKIPYTRVHEFKNYHPERDSFNLDKTVVSREYSVIGGKNKEPYYPINRGLDRVILKSYNEESKKYKNTFFCGRLGEYKYYDMDAVIAKSLSFFNNKPFQEKLKNLPYT